MTPFDDNDLIDRLQSGIAERQSGISAPDGIGDDARRAARKRTATKAAGAGVPLLAAAGVATVLATGSGSPIRVQAGSKGASGPDAGGSATPAAVVSGGPVHSVDTAYIVKRVRANVAASSQDGTFWHSQQFAGGTLGSDGSLLNLGPKLSDTVDYKAPDGTGGFHELMYNEDGTLSLTMADRFSRDADGTTQDAQTIVNPRRQVYSQTQYGDSDTLGGGQSLTLSSSASQVQQALQSGQVTQTGTAMINDTQARALSIAVPNEEFTLYVDAQTYQPLRTVMSIDGSKDFEVTDWLPATADNIAQAEDDSVPAGYAQVAKADVGN
jgi:hypothetical protein